MKSEQYWFGFGKLTKRREGARIKSAFVLK